MERSKPFTAIPYLLVLVLVILPLAFMLHRHPEVLERPPAVEVCRCVQDVFLVCHCYPVERSSDR